MRGGKSNQERGEIEPGEGNQTIPNSVVFSSIHPCVPMIVVHLCCSAGPAASRDCVGRLHVTVFARREAHSVQPAC